MLQNSCAIVTSGVMTWSLFIAVAVHQVEEFVWPGGFRAWYIGYSPHVERALSTSFLVAFNVALLCAAALSAASFASPSMRILWLAIGSGCAINALWHLQATLRTGRYSPGLVTARSSRTHSRISSDAVWSRRATRSPRRPLVRRTGYCPKGASC